MKVALITPFDMLDLAELSDYHLVLPQLLRNETYAKFYSEVSGHKILDNGANEGETFDQSELHDAAHRVGAAEIVIPDALGECDRTIGLAQAFERFAQPQNFRYVGVAQGRSIAEIVKCVTYFSHHPEWVSAIALPRVLNNIHRTQRFNLVEPIAKHYSFDAIHCLGASEWVREIVALDSTNLVRGMDTSLPIVLGLEGVSIRDNRYIPRQRGYFEQTADRKTLKWKVIYDNVTTYLDWAGTRTADTVADELNPPEETS